MHIREYRDSDLAALRVIHAAQGFDYALPDLRNPLFLTKLVLVGEAAAVGAPDPPLQARSQKASDPDTTETEEPRESNKAGNCGAEQKGESRAEHNSPDAPILGAAFLRLTAEAYLLLDPKAGTPRQRWGWLLALHEAARRDAWQRGLEDVHAWLPPPIAQKFGRRLSQLGWLRDDSWTPYCKRL